MSANVEELRSAAREVLEARSADVFLGYEASRLPLRRRACFLRAADQVDRLVWDRACSLNLAAFLPALFAKPAGHRGPWTPPKVAVAAKPCDSRSIALLVRAHQLPRERLLLLGLHCDGMVDRHKLARQAGPAGLAQAAVDGTEVRLQTADGAMKVLPAQSVLADACLECVRREPVGCDKLLGTPSPNRKPRPAYQQVAAFEARPPEERWEAFLAEVSRCIRCYACRQACPNCYCRECFAEETSPCWLGVSAETVEAAFFHLGRALHMAGRCVDCGACVAACPRGLDLRLLTRKVAKDVEEMFGPEAPGVGELPEPLVAFKMDDDQSFMTEP